MERAIPTASSSNIQMRRASVIHQLVPRPGASVSAPLISSPSALMPPPALPIKNNERRQEPITGQLQQYYQNSSGMLQAEPSAYPYPQVRPRPKILRAPTIKSGFAQRRNFIPSYVPPMAKFGNKIVEAVVLDVGPNQPQASTSKGSANGDGGGGASGDTQMGEASGGGYTAGASEPTVTEDDEPKLMYLNKPRVSLWPAQHCPNRTPRLNHFVHRKDFLPVPDQKVSLHKIANRPDTKEKVSGEKLVRFNERMMEVVEIENGVIDKFSSLLSTFESRFGTDNKNPLVNNVAELFKRNIVRCKVLRDQMSESAEVVMGLLDHKPMVESVLEKYKDPGPAPVVPAKKARGGKRTSKK